MLEGYPDNEWVQKVCKAGQDTACCRYLGLAAGGWSCEKHTNLKIAIDHRVFYRQITARGDNCEGKESRR